MLTCSSVLYYYRYILYANSTSYPSYIGAIHKVPHTRGGESKKVSVWQGGGVTTQKSDVLYGWPIRVRLSKICSSIKFQFTYLLYLVLLQLPYGIFENLITFFVYPTDLSKNRFNDVPNQVFDYHSLEQLNCYHNVIKTLPLAITQLQNLVHLNLRYFVFYQSRRQASLIK